MTDLRHPPLGLTQKEEIIANAAAVRFDLGSSALAGLDRAQLAFGLKASAARSSVMKLRGRGIRAKLWRRFQN